MSELGRLRQVGDESRRLKRPVADLTFDKQTLSESLRKKLTPTRRRELAEWFQATDEVSNVRVLTGSVEPYGVVPASPQQVLRARICEIALWRPRCGCQNTSMCYPGSRGGTRISSG